ncbi:hypothetical protein [Streptomyces sp. NBC_01217]|uniref:hypothetical protein n=1 Tax=Streptomyces sp. NBC_01217 TaxID=2903779 RepID=UPI002E11C6C7|nr:hypothetical protein OG507_12205 [Streptomyces sp. NBC_01217]
MSYGYPPTPKQSRTGLIVTLSVVGGVAVLLALGVLIAVSAGNNSAAGDSKTSKPSKRPPAGATEGGGVSEEPTESPVVEGTKAEDDVRITSCELDSVTQWPSAGVEIVNHSGERSSYIVNIEFVDGRGTRHGEGLMSSSSLDAGQKSVGKAQGLGKFTGKLTCKVAKVSRFPAS